MTLSSFRLLLVGLSLMGAAACSGSNTGAYVDGGSAEAPSAAPPSSGTSQPPTDKPDATAAPPDAGPGVDKTPHFDLTLDGSPLTITNVTTSREAATGNRPAAISVEGQYEQQLAGGLTSTATFTIKVAATATGTDACGTDGRSASYLFKDTDGAIRILSTSLAGGSCTMKIFTNAADGFASGSASGTVGGAKTKAFTVAWGQPITKS